MLSNEKDNYTFKDYWNLPDGVRSDLINGHLHIRQTPYRIHQELVVALSCWIGNYLRTEPHSDATLILGPFAVNPDGQRRNWVEPDISIVYDHQKLNEQYCSGAPDWVIEVTSFDSRRMDYIVKNTIYSEAGVREYWIIDPEKERTTVYHYEADDAPTIYTFSQAIPMGIFEGLSITIANLLK